MVSEPGSDSAIKVLFLAAEADPLIKVGGLGDVTSSLPRALRALPEETTAGRPLDVRLALPFHNAIRPKVDNPLLINRFSIPRGEKNMKGELLYVESDNLPIYLLDGLPIQVDAPIYSINTALDGERYTFFSLGILEAIRKTGWKPDIIHAHDWHTAAAIYWLYRHRREDPFYAHARTILTIHNLPFMGGGTEQALDLYGIPAAVDSRLPDWARHFPLPMGLLAADEITTVSPTYAQEILTRDFGSGLHEFLRTRQKDITGILNGLDMDLWDPGVDAVIPSPFTKDTLEERETNKRALLTEMDLNHNLEIPLLAFIGRMDPQKGLDLAINALRVIADQPWQVILLGTGVPGLEEAAQKFEQEFPDRIRAMIRFDSGLARRIYAGSDMLLMPSRYEPCGLAQMIAMRYGCLPVANATGGLRDTIIDDKTPENSTGFLFKAPRALAMEETLHRAFETFPDKPAWRQMQQNGMSLDFSWQRSAARYAELYEKLRSKTL